MEILKSYIIPAIAVLAICAAVRFIIKFLETREKLLISETNEMILNQAPDLIAAAEQAYSEVEKSGTLKMQQCIDVIMPQIPAAVAGLFDEDTVRGIIQAVFDSVKKYAIINIDKAAESLAEKAVTISKSRKASKQKTPESPVITAAEVEEVE